MIERAQWGLNKCEALVAGARRALCMATDGSVTALGSEAAQARYASGEIVPLVCHARLTARRIGLKRLTALDLLELFAFVAPARFCLPTPEGLASALGLPAPSPALEARANTLFAAARALLGRLAQPDLPERARVRAIAHSMTRAGWLWGALVERALNAGNPSETETQAGAGAPLAVWSALKEWQDTAPPAAPDHFAVSPEEAQARLRELIGLSAEARPEQAAYAGAVSAAFQPRDEAGRPQVVLAEAGTGVGKTRAYLAPASLWAERNEGTVWISTYTRNLQRQIDQELDRLYPDAARKAERVVVRKGRENYLCLLNYEEALARSALLPADRIALGLIARYILASRDGDMQGGDFPAWLVDLLGARRTLGLTDRRGECIYSACPHYRRCFIEKNQRRARAADIVVANHALVMVQTARLAFGAEGDRRAPTRFVFDEAHHLFDAADSTFASYLSGAEAAELRRWLSGPERARDGESTSRARGLKSRLGDLLVDRRGALELLDEALKGARVLPGEGWYERLQANTPQGPTERFLALVRRQVLARVSDPHARYGLEAPVWPLGPALGEAALALEQALAALSRPLQGLIAALEALLDDEAAALDSTSRSRVEALLRGLHRRLTEQIAAWRGMVASLAGEGLAGDADDLESSAPAGAPEGFVDWFEISRSEGREHDVGMRRHQLDPTIPFAQLLFARAHGVLMTSATLSDQTGDPVADWAVAEFRTGARHLEVPARRVQVASPFDYARQTRVFVVNDLRRGELAQLAAAYRELFLAARGGALGLFTAIERLRAVHGEIAPALEEAGLALWAQHVDALDTPTLVDIFRADEDSCLLGTDAVRDGVDVPGRSLRLLVFDRVPWPRPDLLHKARRAAFGGRAYDDLIARLRLKQAYGRLIRRADDRGAFVLLDGALPSRLLGAFPAGVAIERVGLAEAVAGVRGFLAPVSGQALRVEA